VKPRGALGVVGRMKMKNLIGIAMLLGACGGKQPAPAGGSGSADPIGVVSDTRTAIEKRRDTACEQVGARVTACAVADAKAELDAGRITKAEFDTDTAPGIQRKLTEEWVKGCRVPMSSRQVRVLEVCLREEQECGPFADCLTHLNDQKGK
jgi:hypothetical protein